MTNSLRTGRLLVGLAALLGALTALLLVSFSSASAATTITLSGTVQDSSGGAVANTSIQVRNNSTGAEASTRTDASGAYGITLVPGDYHVSFSDGTQTGYINSLSITSDQVEDFTFGQFVRYTMTVVDANGTAAPGVSVVLTGGGGATGTTQDGTHYYVDASPPVTGTPCTTDSVGQCTLRALVGPTTGGTYTFNVTPASGPGTTFGATPTLTHTADTVTLPAAGATLRGELINSSGTPAAGATVLLRNLSSGVEQSATADSDGSYSLGVVPGDYHVSFSDGTQTGYINSLSITSDQIENFTFGQFVQYTMTVVDANGSNAPGVSVLLTGGGGATGTTQDGTRYYVDAYPPVTGTPCTTDSTGKCALRALVGPTTGGTYTFSVAPPTGLSTIFGARPTLTHTSDTVQLDTYAVVASSGSSTGSVTVTAPEGTSLSNVTSQQAPQTGLPTGAVALTGALGYQLSGVDNGSTADVTVQLPAGSKPTNVYKYQNNSYIDVSSIATITGDTIVLHITDGGLGDSDGAANGVIVDPLVPVRLAQKTQAITFTSTAPTTAGVGGPTYSISATGGGSGKPVTFGVDASSTGVCSVSGSTVTFLGVGTCTIDADQAGDQNYLAAPQARQSFSVAKGSQVIAFTAPAQGLVGSSATLTATGGKSGLPVTFSVDASSGSGVCRVSGTNGTTVRYLAAGTCVLDANQAGNTNYLAASRVQQSISVRKSQTITFGTLSNKTLAQSPVTVSASASSGLAATFSSTTSSVCTVTGTSVKLLTAGTCTIKADQAGNATYAAASPVSRSFTVSKAGQTITFAAIADKSLSQSPVTVSASASSGLALTFSSTTSSVCTVTGTSVKLLTAGTCTIKADQAGNATYSPAPTITRSFRVKR